MNIHLRRLWGVWMGAWVAFVSFTVSAASVDVPRTADHFMGGVLLARDGNVLSDKGYSGTVAKTTGDTDTSVSAQHPANDQLTPAQMREDLAYGTLRDLVVEPTHSPNPDPAWGPWLSLIPVDGNEPDQWLQVLDSVAQRPPTYQPPVDVSTEWLGDHKRWWRSFRAVERVRREVAAGTASIRG